MGPSNSAVVKKDEKVEMVTVIYEGKRLLVYAGHQWQPAKGKNDKILDGRMGTAGPDGEVYEHQINKKRGYTGHGSAFQIVPGMNVMPKKLWEEMEKAHDLADLIENEVLHLFDPKKKEGVKAASTPGLADDLEAYSDKDAIQLIQNTMSGETLTKWKRSLAANRPKVHNVLDDQIRKIYGQAAEE